MWRREIVLQRMLDRFVRRIRRRGNNTTPVRIRELITADDVRLFLGGQLKEFDFSTPDAVRAWIANHFGPRFGFNNPGLVDPR